MPTDTVGSVDSTAASTTEGATNAAENIDAVTGGVTDETLGAEPVSGVLEPLPDVSEEVDAVTGGLAEGILTTEPATDSVVEPLNETLGGQVDATLGDTVADAGADAVEPVAELAEPVADTLQPVTDAIEPVSDTLAPLADSVADAGADAVEPMAELAEPVADALQPVTDSIEPVADAVEAVSDTLPSLADAAAVETVKELAEPVADAVETVSDTVAPLADSVVNADGGALLTMRQVPEVTDPLQPVTTTVQQVTEPVQQVTEPVQQVTEPVQQVTEPVQQVTEPVQQVTQPVQQVTDAASGAVETVNQAAAATAAANELAAETATAVSGASEPIEGAVGQVRDQSAALSDTVATMLAGAGGGPGGTFGGPGGTFGGPGEVPGSVGDSDAALGTRIADIEESVVGSDRAFGALPFETPGLIAGADEALLVTAGLVTVAGLALAVKGSGPSALLTAQFFLANVKQIPLVCGIREIVNRQVSAAVSGAAQLGRAGGAGASAVKAAVAPEQLGRAIRDGFARGVRGLGTEDDGTSDTRLLMQLGMLLGTVYLAFLTVWFWATRLRWNPRM